MALFLSALLKLAEGVMMLNIGRILIIALDLPIPRDDNIWLGRLHLEYPLARSTQCISRKFRHYAADAG